MRGLLVDLDDTLYGYGPADAAARAALFDAVAGALGRERADVEAAYADARRAVKRRVGPRASAHSRLLYLHEMLYALGRPDASAAARGWERLYWDALLGAATLADGAADLLDGARARGWRVAVVTDLTLDVQLRKCDALGLAGRIDALVASEEVEADKPHPAVFRLAAERIGVPLDRCVVVGDDDARDGEGARALGLTYLPAGAGGARLREVAARLWQGDAR